MNAKLVEEIADAVLYEGYMLYPYRGSSIKNQQRWNFGVLYPRSFSEAQGPQDPWSMQTECLARSPAVNARLTATVRFLQLVERVGSGQTWQEGDKRDVTISGSNLSALALNAHAQDFVFPESEGRERVQGRIEMQTESLGEGLFKLRLRVLNTAPLENGAVASRNDALMRSLVSTHAILHLENGEFISLLDPPEELREFARQCKNAGFWPVLAGEEEQRDAMLCSPIILYDYPQIAPESAGSLFDGTEIDEILTLRIMTLTDDEKREMHSGDERAREILERTESMPPEQLMKLHGALRGLRRTTTQDTP